MNHCLLRKLQLRQGESRTYDLTLTDRKGQLTQYTYDSLDQLTQVQCK